MAGLRRQQQDRCRLRLLASCDLIRLQTRLSKNRQGPKCSRPLLPLNRSQPMQENLDLKLQIHQSILCMGIVAYHCSSKGEPWVCEYACFRRPSASSFVIVRLKDLVHKTGSMSRMSHCRMTARCATPVPLCPLAPGQVSLSGLVEHVMNSRNSIPGICFCFEDFAEAKSQLFS